MPQNKTCKNCAQTFVIDEWDKAYYKKMELPEPQNCPECRLIRRLQERNPRKLYYRKCDLGGEQMVSQYHEDQPFPVYCVEHWYGDGWDATELGRDFDFTRPFFDQFKELRDAAPHLGLFTFAKDRMINSEFNNCAGDLKNCYLVAETDGAEDCYYSNLIKRCKNTVDCSVCYNNELCYECTDCTNCYNLTFSQDCETCNNSYFLKNCQACSDCIGSINLRHKQYMIFNKQYSKEEYEKIKQEMKLDTRPGLEDLRQKSAEFFKTQIHRNLQQEHNQNSLGDHLYNAKDSLFCTDCKEIEDSKYCFRLAWGAKSCMDYNSWGTRAELTYQSSSCGEDIYNLKFCTNCMTNVSNVEYSDLCAKGSSDLFGCVSLKKKQYCILNKQYSKEEYESLRKRIIEHMKKTGEYGEFFPQSHAVFTYNESLALDIFPLTKEEALKKGFTWKDDHKKIQPSTYLIPETAQDLNDEVVKAILVCDQCQKNYKIIAPELQFYKKMGIPAPLKCPDCRHANRVKRRNPIKLWERQCAKCQAAIKTSYAPDRPEKVYCEKCYLEAVY